MSRNWKKRFGLGWELRWLTTVCLRGFDRKVQQLFTLHQRLQRTLKNEQKQLSISNHHSQVPRWRALVSLKSCFDACLECQVTLISKLNFKKNVHAEYWFLKKKSVHQLDSNLRPPECKSVALPIELLVLWFSMECCLSFLHFFVFNLLQNGIWSLH